MPSPISGGDGNHEFLLGAHRAVHDIGMENPGNFRNA
jgi:hypothetical protein